ncbi:MAG: hypothetical protein IKO20_04025 [Bacteroidaceae bacterium]|nr:hypothetical protein [Bacteroidaceae bacterium]
MTAKEKADRIDELKDLVGYIQKEIERAEEAIMRLAICDINIIENLCNNLYENPLLNKVHALCKELDNLQKQVELLCEARAKLKALENTEKATSTLWIARDKDAKLWLYVKKPHRSTTVFVDSDLTSYMHIDDREDSKVRLCPDLFPEVTWENSPQQLKLF